MYATSVRRGQRSLQSAKLVAELTCRRCIEKHVGTTLQRTQCTVRARSRWKKRKQAEHKRLETVCSIDRSVVPLARLRGNICGPLDWILTPLRERGYAVIRFGVMEKSIVDTLFTSSRFFFGRPKAYKESFKFFPVPGGYMTPYPGSHEIFEIRRGLISCPTELIECAMPAFQLLERLAKNVCLAIGRDIGVDVAKMPTDSSPTMRCLHYDRPQLSRGDADVPESPTRDCAHLARGTLVRVVGLEGEEMKFNGAKGEVLTCSGDQVTVAITVPSHTAKSIGEQSPVHRKLELRNVRRLINMLEGMYEAHADSSLVTLAPRSSVAGLDVKDVQTGEWFNIEETMDDDECLVFVGDPLDYVSSHRYPSLMHRPAVRDWAVHRRVGHRISTPFFLYPHGSTTLCPPGLPKLVFDDLNGNVDKCRDGFPWKRESCYYSDMVYSDNCDRS